MAGLESISSYIWNDHSRSNEYIFEYKGKLYDLSQDKGLAKTIRDHPGGPDVLRAQFRLDGPMAGFHAAANIPAKLAGLTPLSPGRGAVSMPDRPASPEFFKATRQNPTSTDAVRFDKARQIFYYADGREAAVPDEIQEVCRTFHERMGGKNTMPCGAGKSARELAFVMRHYEYPMGDPRNTEKLLIDVTHMGDYTTEKHHQDVYYTTFVALFPDHPKGPAQYDSSTINSKDVQQLRQQLHTMNPRLGRKVPLSTQKWNYGLVDLGPDAPRIARRFGVRALAFNRDDQFTWLKNTDQMEWHKRSIRKNDRLHVSKSELRDPPLPRVEILVPEHTLKRELEYIEQALSVPEWSSHPFVARQLLSRLASRLSAMPDRQAAVRQVLDHQDSEHIGPDRVLQWANDIPPEDRMYLYSLLAPVPAEQDLASEFEKLKGECFDPEWGFDAKRVNRSVAKLATYVPAALRAGIEVDELLYQIGYRSRLIGPDKVIKLAQCWHPKETPKLSLGNFGPVSPASQFPADDLVAAHNELFKVFTEAGNKPSREQAERILELLAKCSPCLRDAIPALKRASGLWDVLGIGRMLEAVDVLHPFDRRRLYEMLFRATADADAEQEAAQRWCEQTLDRDWADDPTEAKILLGRLLTHWHALSDADSEATLQRIIERRRALGPLNLLRWAQMFPPQLRDRVRPLINLVAPPPPPPPPPPLSGFDASSESSDTEDASDSDGEASRSATGSTGGAD